MKIYLFFLLSIFTTSCSVTTMYTPNQDVIDHISEKSQWMGSGNVSHSVMSKYQVSSSYGLTNKLAVSGTFCKSSKEHYGSLSLGVYGKSGTRAFWDIYTGYGLGKGFERESSFFRGDGFANSYYSKLYLQAGHHLLSKNELFQFDFNIKLNALDFYLFEAFGDYVPTNFANLSQKGVIYLPEINIRSSFKGEFFNLHWGVLYQFNQNQQFNFSPYNIFAGASIPLTRFIR